MKKIFLSVFIFSLSAGANSIDSLGSFSAVRNKKADYRLYKEASSTVRIFTHESPHPSFLTDEINETETNPAKETAAQRASHYTKLDVLGIPEVNSYETLRAYFELIRDSRFLRAETAFPRRISWLYPDDGCFVRAELMVTQLEEFINLKKMYIFGNLNVKTDNAFGGEVSWWYHVAPVVRVGFDVYILDPAVNPEAPILLLDWILRQVPEIEDVELSICDASTFTPGNRCDKDVVFEPSVLVQFQDLFLDKEWVRQSVLKNKPEEVLGENPPWMLPEIAPIRIGVQ